MRNFSIFTRSRNSLDRVRRWFTDLSDYLENELLDHVFGQGAYTAPTPYLALFTVAPSDAGGGTEVTGGSYARQDLTTLMATASGGAISNDAAITFPTATGDWGTIVAVGIFDALTVGNLLLWTTITNKEVLTDDTAELAIGDLTATLD